VGTNAPPIPSDHELLLLFSYVNKDRNITKRIVMHAEKRGIQGLFITVDAPQLGRREKVESSHLI
jgi:isopentenyl diphosphate isomerase/L-lactate dehydrogenase-like FMN-dependent dehydrogenase